MFTNGQHMDFASRLIGLILAKKWFARPERCDFKIVGHPRAGLGWRQWMEKNCERNDITRTVMIGR